MPVQKRGQCVFCGGFGLSKEHIFADWMKDYLPGERIQVHHEIVRHQLNENLEPIGRTRSRGRLSRQGPIRSLKLRIVCESCNSGWMSELQKKAKPILIGFIKGVWRKLTPDEQRILAAWATMFTMVSEHADPDTSTVSHEHREYLMNNQRPPKNWYVWIGLFAHKTSLYRHHGFKKRSKSTGALTDNCVVQSTFLAPGRAAFLTLSDSSGGFSPEQLDAVGALARQTSLRRLWPASTLFRASPPPFFPFIAGQVWIFGDTLIEALRLSD